jgi:prephenate dehydrogenase
MHNDFKNIVICGAGGEIAQLFLQHIKNDFKSARVIGIDCVKLISTLAYDEYIISDLNHRESLAELEHYFRSADLIVLALPAFVAITLLNFLAMRNISNAAIVETLSVKSKFYGELSLHKKHGYLPEVIGLNPLFRPDIGFLNNNVLYLMQNPSEKTSAFLQMLKNTGAKLLEVTVNTHEEKMAVVQAGTHAITLIYGMLLKEFNYNIDEYLPFCTPAHRHLLQLLARILAGEPHVYEEIQLENKHAARVRKNIMDLASNFNDLITEKINFDALFCNLQKTLGEQQPLLAQECQRSISLQNNNKEPQK